MFGVGVKKNFHFFFHFFKSTFLDNYFLVWVGFRFLGWLKKNYNKIKIFAFIFSKEQFLFNIILCASWGERHVWGLGQPET